MKNYKHHFSKILKIHFPDNAISMESEIERQFDLLQRDVHFSKSSTNPVDRRMEIAAYFLATIQVLDREKLDFSTIRNVVIEIAREAVRPKNRFQAFLKRLPARLVDTFAGKILLKIFARKVSRLAHPDGFKVSVLTRKEETLGFGYGFDILECGICKLFQKHDYQRFTFILCEVDFITSGLAGLKLVRSGTIASGAK